MVSTWESKFDKGILVEAQFKEDNTIKWHPVCYDNEEEYYKIEDGPRNFKDGSRVQSVQGYRIYYYDDLRWNATEEVDVFYFLGDKVYSKKYSFNETKEEEDGWKLSELHEIPCRQEKMQLALRFKGLEGVSNGYYRFKPLNGTWEKSKASFKTTVKEEDLHGYDVKYHDGDTDTLFVDRNGDIYSDNYSFGNKKAPPIAYTVYGQGTPPPYYNPDFTNTSATKSNAKRKNCITPSVSTNKRKKTSPAPATTPGVLSKSAEHSVQHQQGGMVTNEGQVRSNGQQQSSPQMESIVNHVSNSSWKSPEPNSNSNCSVCLRCSDNGSPSEEEENKKEKETSVKVAKLKKEIEIKDNLKNKLDEIKVHVLEEHYKLKAAIVQEQEGLQLVYDLSLFLKNEKAYNDNEWGETKLKTAFKHIRTHFNPECENEKKILKALGILEKDFPIDLYNKVPYREALGNDDLFEKIEAYLKRAEAKIIPIVYSVIAKYEDNKKFQKEINTRKERLKMRRELRQRSLEKLLGQGGFNN